MRHLSCRLAVVIVTLIASSAAAAAQSSITEFELQVMTAPDRSVTVRCVRGCSLVVLVHHPVEDVMRWDRMPHFNFRCRTGNCSSGKVLGGAAPATTEGFVSAPAFDLLVENKIVDAAMRTVVRCVRGCSFAAVVGAPRPGAPEPERVKEAQFPCNDQGCASGRISGWLEPRR